MVVIGRAGLQFERESVAEGSKPRHGAILIEDKISAFIPQTNTVLTVRNGGLVNSRTQVSSTLCF